MLATEKPSIENLCQNAPRPILDGLFSLCRLGVWKESSPRYAPPLSSDSIVMFPARHPNHDSDDLNHLIPQFSRELYHAQEGYNKALHGSKHSQIQATFSHPTVVLDHSDHLRNIKCDAHSIEICFTTEQAKAIAQETWKLDPKTGAFQLVTYHLGCGDTTGHKRSYFRVSRPVTSTATNCLSVPVAPVDEPDALESGEVFWGTYEASAQQKRALQMKGHIKSAGTTLGLIPNSTSNMPNNTSTVDIEHNMAAAKEFF
ncbi:uncharacterized protein N7469_002068 [Penicillium citrinum]|uniref:DUF7029 domain-containing protein n=1 Tax=Penicillium citrinum TaxID=5077 RepID=A0A9W9PCQ4_PENCI|nr:uncharacterized protein N7469_002068 [Penicillium citrinum]KAJ5240477.1 hypothetical protein N7469_002068 [Penicillium citrinum]